MKTPEPIGSKEERLNMASPTVESLRVVLVEGSWNDSFVEQISNQQYNNINPNNTIKQILRLSFIIYNNGEKCRK